MSLFFPNLKISQLVQFLWGPVTLPCIFAWERFIFPPVIYFHIKGSLKLRRSAEEERRRPFKEKNEESTRKKEI